MTLVIVVVAVVVVVAAAVAFASKRRRQVDGVDSFRRQIDALSPEARRPTIKQIKPDDEPGPEEPAVADEAGDTEQPSEEDPDGS